MHFRRGICILFWCDYVGLYMVGTLNAFSARVLQHNVYKKSIFWCDYVGLYMVGHSQCIFNDIQSVRTFTTYPARYLYTFLV